MEAKIFDSELKGDVKSWVKTPKGKKGNHYVKDFELNLAIECQSLVKN